VLVEGHREQLRVAFGQVFVRGSPGEQQAVIEGGFETECMVGWVRLDYLP
jgi:hypothetical protein